MLWCILFCGWYDRIKMKYWRSFIEIKAAGDWQKRKSIISACARLSLHTGDLITHLTTTTTTDNSPNPQPLVLLSHKVYQGNAAMWPFFMFFCEKKNKYFLLKDWKYSFQALLYTLYSTGCFPAICKSKTKKQTLHWGLERFKTFFPHSTNWE